MRAYTYTNIYVWCVAEHVCKWLHIYIYLKPYTYCTILWRANNFCWPCNLCHFWVHRVPLVPVAASDCPTQHLALANLVMMNCSRNYLLSLSWLGDWIWGLVCMFQNKDSARCDHRNMRPVGWASWSREELPLGWSLHLLFPWSKQETGLSLEEVNRSGINPFKEAGGTAWRPVVFVINQLSSSWLRSWMVLSIKFHPFKRK